MQSLASDGYNKIIGLFTTKTNSQPLRVGSPRESIADSPLASRAAATKHRKDLDNSVDNTGAGREFLAESNITEMLAVKWKKR